MCPGVRVVGFIPHIRFAGFGEVFVLFIAFVGCAVFFEMGLNGISKRSRDGAEAEGSQQERDKQFFHNVTFYDKCIKRRIVFWLVGNFQLLRIGHDDFGLAFIVNDLSGDGNGFAVQIFDGCCGLFKHERQ